MSTATCAGCGRQVRLKASSPAGPICSACHARRHTGTCGSCGRDTVLVGRNSDGQPWCNRCYTAATAAHLRICSTHSANASAAQPIVVNTVRRRRGEPLIALPYRTDTAPYRPNSGA